MGTPLTLVENNLHEVSVRGKDYLFHIPSKRNSKGGTRGWFIAVVVDTVTWPGSGLLALLVYSSHDETMLQQWLQLLHLFKWRSE